MAAIWGGAVMEGIHTENSIIVHDDIYECSQSRWLEV